MTSVDKIKRHLIKQRDNKSYFTSIDSKSGKYIFSVIRSVQQLLFATFQATNEWNNSLETWPLWWGSLIPRLPNPIDWRHFGIVTCSKRQMSLLSAKRHLTLGPKIWTTVPDQLSLVGWGSLGTIYSNDDFISSQDLQHSQSEYSENLLLI